MSNYNAAPKFTPPASSAPSFAPPTGRRRSHDMASCYYHQGEQAVATCARCGKQLCDDCYEAYGVSSGEYTNKALCYDCTRQLVAENVQELTANKRTIKMQFILSLIGIVIGFVIGLSVGLSEGTFGTGMIFGVIGAGIGGVFLSFLKVYFKTLWEAIKVGFSHGILAAVIGFFIAIVITAFKAVFRTIMNTIDYITYLKRTSGFIESDTAALEQMREYMEYTRVRNENKGVDLETLLDEGSELYNNSFARMVRDQGEEAATETISRAATRIAENGEIIRDFAA